MEKHQSRNNDKGIRMAMKKIDLHYKRQTWYTENLCITQTVAGNDVRRWQLRPTPSPPGEDAYMKRSRWQDASRKIGIILYNGDQTGP